MTRATTSTHGILEPGTGRAHFELTRRAPSAHLADHVERHWIVEWDLRGAEPFVQEILPHPCVNLSSEPGLIAVYGIPLSRSPHRLEGSGVVVGTKFRPGGFAGFIDTPTSGLNDRVVALAELFGGAGAHLERELARRAGDPDGHIEAVEAFLRERLPAPDLRFELVRAVVGEMLVATPGTTVAELAERHAVSQRTLQRLFRDHVGVGPKWVLKRYRIHEAAERIAAGEVDDQASLALELGYFDQPHFIRDFTAQIGRSPGAYARACAAAAGRDPGPALARRAA
jgi:AraC-like DNA-binding protein